MHIPVWAFSFVCICVSTALPKDKMQLAAMRKLCNKDILNKHSTHCKDNLEQWEVFTTESCKINIEYVEKNTFEQRMWSVLPYFRRLLEAQFFLYYEEQVADIFVDMNILWGSFPAKGTHRPLNLNRAHKVHLSRRTPFVHNFFPRW